jgi:hypothetical protein
MRVVFIALVLCGLSAAQLLTLEQAVKQSVEKYPSVKVSREQAAAAAAGIALARILSAQGRLHLAGEPRHPQQHLRHVAPQSVIAPISGPLCARPPVPVSSGAIASHVAWEPFDFELRKSAVDAAESAAATDAATERRAFDVATSAAAFLTILAAEETVKPPMRASNARGWWVRLWTRW